MHHKYPISVAIIAHNEVNNIRRCIESVAEWVQEIVVVVNDCNDGTEDVAARYGAKVIRESWHGFRDQKNIALDHCTQPWVLSLDADEAVDPALAFSIGQFVEANDGAYAGAYFPRKVWFMGRWITHGDWYPDYSLRLFRNKSARWIGTTVHERLQLYGEKKLLSGELLHYSYPTIHKQLEKVHYFSELFLQEQVAKGKRFCPWETCGRAFWRFFRAYFLRCGFLDGFPGLYVAGFTAFYTLLRYARIYEYEKTPSVHESVDEKLRGTKEKVS